MDRVKDPERAKKYQRHLEEKRSLYKYIGRSYADAPEGEDMEGKLIWANRYAFAFGTFWAAVDIMGSPPITKVSHMIFTVVRRVLPLMGVGSAYTLGTYASVHYRKKDDYVNHMYGGVAAGALVGLMISKPAYGLYACLIFPLFGGCHKHSLIISKRHELPYRETLSPYWSRKLDFSLVPERKGNWTSQQQS
ncbi:hypothetical protein RUM43_005016 [Polyplax serrata]|uniref:NADH dehydrogenase [ubiquinone] 1 alpha subcomplex subunit 11 n=1 Tax=Polyplax serrata TaxID=468196 RepID=A0AAN8SCF7_POLSC